MTENLALRLMPPCSESVDAALSHKVHKCSQTVFVFIPSSCSHLNTQKHTRVPTVKPQQCSTYSSGLSVPHHDSVWHEAVICQPHYLLAINYVTFCGVASYGNDGSVYISQQVVKFLFAPSPSNPSWSHFIVHDLITVQETHSFTTNIY